MDPKPADVVYLHDGANNDNLNDLCDEEAIGMTDKQSVLLASFETIRRWDTDRRPALVTEEQVGRKFYATRSYTLGRWTNFHAQHVAPESQGNSPKLILPATKSKSYRLHLNKDPIDFVPGSMAMRRRH
jgi:hypothetical protein